MPTNDVPVTDAELEQHAGVPASQIDIEIAIGAACCAFDSGELGDVCATNYEEIAEAIANGDLEQVGEIVARVRRERIAYIASMELFGKTGVIHERQVKV